MMSTTPYEDEKYYQAAQPRSLGARLMTRARDRVYADFLRICAPRPDETILDVGVSDVITDGANVLERKYPFPQRITAAGLGVADSFSRAFPAIDYVRIEANRPLPFADRAFAIATANAVLEHVGSTEDQLRFVAELTRVARRVYITVPNRYFPIEHHTALPLVHFSDAGFAAACRWSGKAEWAEERNLILMSEARLRATVPPGIRAATGTTGIPLGPFSSNLYLYIDRESA
jgi:hypothetical protein